MPVHTHLRDRFEALLVPEDAVQDEWYLGDDSARLVEESPKPHRYGFSLVQTEDWATADWSDIVHSVGPSGAVRGTVYSTVPLRNVPPSYNYVYLTTPEDTERHLEGYGWAPLKRRAFNLETRLADAQDKQLLASPIPDSSLDFLEVEYPDNVWRHWILNFPETETIEALEALETLKARGPRQLVATQSNRNKSDWINAELEHIFPIRLDTPPETVSAWTRLGARIIAVEPGRAFAPEGIISVVDSPEQPSSEQTPTTIREHIDWIEQKWTHRIEYLSKLEPDWDGYGAKAISEDAIAQCQQILAETAQVPRHRLLQLFIAPLSNGGLELEWDSPSGNELMTVIPPDEGPLEYLSTILDSTGEKVEKDGTIPGDATLSALLDQVSE